MGKNQKKRNLIGTHVLTIELNSGVTMEQFLDFYTDTLLPEHEKHYEGWKSYLAKGIRGENETTYGWIIIIDSEEKRNKYYNADGSPNALGEAISEKMKTVLEEGNKFGKVTSKYTDWLVL